MVLAERGFLRHDTQATGDAGSSWTALARLPEAGDPVELEVRMWTGDAAEINIRPALRRPLGLSLSRRHERRYFDDAHRAAAELAASASGSELTAAAA